MLFERRQFLRAVVGAPLLLPAVQSLARTHRPICCFSLTGGWSDIAGEKIPARPTDLDDPSGIPAVVDRIKRALGFSTDIEVFITRNNENNAFATLVDGRKLLVVDAGFLGVANKLAGTDWAAIEIIAHEVGHHIAGFADDSYVCELNADYWSGQSLGRLGAGEDAAKKSMLAVGDPSDTDTHPNKYRRAVKIDKGWQDAKAGSFDYSHCDDRCRP